jgi:hypothetical protein
MALSLGAKPPVCCLVLVLVSMANTQEWSAAVQGWPASANQIKMHFKSVM